MIFFECLEFFCFFVSLESPSRQNHPNLFKQQALQHQGDDLAQQEDAWPPIRNQHPSSLPTVTLWTPHKGCRTASRKFIKRATGSTPRIFCCLDVEKIGLRQTKTCNIWYGVKTKQEKWKLSVCDGLAPWKVYGFPSVLYSTMDRPLLS